MADEGASTQKSIPVQMQIWDLAFGFYRTLAMTVAAQLNLADHLASGPLHVDELAKRANAHGPSLFRLLRALETIGIFKQTSPHVFANTPLSEPLGKSFPGSAQPGFLCIAPGSGQFEAWSGLLESIQTGEVAFDRIYGYTFWEFLKRNPRQSDEFNQSMAASRALGAKMMAELYDWSRFPVIADIGGGIGGQLVAILDANPKCRGILFDLPEGLQGHVPHERIEVVAGNFFETVPRGADAYILRTVVHGWPDDVAVKILKSVRAAMTPAARLMVIERLLPETSEPGMSVWMDLHMLVIAGGRERTATELRELLRAGGFEVDEIVTTPTGNGLVVARPV